MGEINGKIEERDLNTEVFNLKLTTLERKMDDNTEKVCSKLAEMVTEMRLTRESLLSAALGISPRHDGALMSIVKPIITTVLWAMTAMVVWFTGLREILPHFTR